MLAPVGHDPVVANPKLYRVVFENERVRVLEYRDEPGDRTVPHSHPDSVMGTPGRPPPALQGPSARLPAD